jgi:hypothetical protein
MMLCSDLEDDTLLSLTETKPVAPAPPLQLTEETFASFHKCMDSLRERYMELDEMLVLDNAIPQPVLARLLKDAERYKVRSRYERRCLTAATAVYQPRARPKLQKRWQRRR